MGSWFYVDVVTLDPVCFFLFGPCEQVADVKGSQPITEVIACMLGIPIATAVGNDAHLDLLFAFFVEMQFTMGHAIAVKEHKVHQVTLAHKD